MRRLALACGILILAIAVAVTAAIALRFQLAAFILRRGLARAGFPEVRFVIERLDPSAIVITALDAGESLRADALEVDLALGRLPALPIGRLRLVRPYVDLTSPAKAESSRGTSSPTLPLVLLPLLEIEEGRIVLPSAAGPVTIELRSQAADGPSAKLDGTVSGSGIDAVLHAETRLAGRAVVSMTVQVPSFSVGVRSDPGLVGSANGTFDVETAGFDVGSAKGRLELGLASSSDLGEVSSVIPLELSKRDGRWLAKVSDAAIRTARYELDATGISADASGESVELRVARLADTSAARRFTPLSLHLDWRDTAPAATFSAEVSMAQGRAALQGSGTYDRAAGRARSNWKLPRTRLDPQGLRLADLAPELESVAARGAVEGTAKVEWTDKGIAASGGVVVDDLSLDTPSVRVDGLSGTVDLARLFPPATTAAQTLRAREIHPGVSFTDATLRFGFEPVDDGRASRLHIERFDTSFADGRLVVEGARIDPLSATNRLDFRIENADVGRLFEIAGLADTSGTGRLSGVIPVVVQGGAVAISKGTLEAKDGRLQMRSEQAASVLAGGGQSATLLLDVLRDFHYDDLVVTIDKTFTGDASVLVHLEGNNPAVLEAQPFRINLNVSGNLDRLVASLAEVARLSDRAVHATVRGARQEAR